MTEHLRSAQPWSARSRPLLGAVSSFDDERGVGVIVDEQGRSVPFHCTAISDGSRSINVGTPVVFEVAAGHGGTLEARGVTPWRPTASGAC